MNNYLWLLGCGAHAQEYFRVLTALKANFDVVGRGIKKAKDFEAKTNKNVVTGGVECAVKSLNVPKIAIVAVSFETLARVACELIRLGVKIILLEKPAGLNIEQVVKINKLAQQYEVRVYVAYNRRFYESTNRLIQELKNCGGINSCHFDFTEWKHIIESWSVPEEVKQKLIISNSSHVIDLCQYICGQIHELHSNRYNALPWHKTGSIFVGFGKTTNNIPFSYHADWSSPGRWSVEIMTPEKKFIMKPLEKLYVINAKSSDLHEIELEDDKDKCYKPGLFNLTSAFLDGDYSKFNNLEDQIKLLTVCSKIGGYINDN